jgi:mannosyl-oligosaccharide alpha-1,2-mannosidase
MIRYYTRRKSLFWGSGILLWLYYWLLSTRWEPPLVLESVELESFMNSRYRQIDVSESRSSFNWSSVAFHHPPPRLDQMTKLPRGRPASLPRIQHAFKPEVPALKSVREYRRQEVKRLFLKNWRSYKDQAWMKDALMPISGGYKDQFCGWAATLVDSLDTLWIMGLKEEFDEAVAAVADIDFGESTSFRVNTFETTIRYLGGLLAAYDLSGREILLQKAVEIGDMMYAGFNTPNRMPVDFIDFVRAKSGEGLSVEGHVVSASPGTLSMELTRLSQITGDPKYYDAISKVINLFYDHQMETRLPGMWPMMVSMSSQDVVSGGRFTLGGCADSLYEYLPKMHLLLGGLDSKFEKLSHRFMETANRALFFRPMTPENEDILISGSMEISSDHSHSFNADSEHLTCFIGGVYALAGKLFRKESYVDIGLKLTRGCMYAYRSFPTGIMPECYNMIACESRDKCEWNETLWEEETSRQYEWKSHLPKAFTTARDPRYLLRPEAIESVFVSYRVSGREEFQDAAWDMFKAINKGTQTSFANAAVLDVTVDSDDLPKEDYMEVSPVPNIIFTPPLLRLETDTYTEFLVSGDVKVLLFDLFAARSNQPG